MPRIVNRLPRRPAKGSNTPARKKAMRRNDPEGLRRRVLDAASTLFQARGYHATSMQDLMLETAVTGGALHHHFPTKKSLVLAVFEERVAPAVREAWIEPIRSSPSLGEGVALAFDRIAGGIEQRGAVTGCPLNNLALELALDDPAFRHAASLIFADWQQAIVERLLETAGGRDLAEPARAEVATFVVASYSGAMALAKTEQSARALRDTASALQEWLRSRRLDR
jgi:TetR/AcrR family transcriptional regulator, transcriptional repressor for nem operon